MIRQVVKNEKLLRKLLREEIRERALPAFTPTEEELDNAVNDFFKDHEVKTYPIFIQFDVLFKFRAFDYTLIFSSCILTKDEMQNILNEL